MNPPVPIVENSKNKKSKNKSVSAIFQKVFRFRFIRVLRIFQE